MGGPGERRLEVTVRPDADGPGFVVTAEVAGDRLSVTDGHLRVHLEGVVVLDLALDGSHDVRFGQTPFPTPRRHGRHVADDTAGGAYDGTADRPASTPVNVVTAASRAAGAPSP